eukprot:10420307-Karenia_brevis.AAC.1
MQTHAKANVAKHRWMVEKSSVVVLLADIAENSSIVLSLSQLVPHELAPGVWSSARLPQTGSEHSLSQVSMDLDCCSGNCVSNPAHGILEIGGGIQGFELGDGNSLPEGDGGPH